MNRLALLLLILLSTGMKANDTKEVSSSIDHVTVFLQQAQIERSASFNISAGVTEVVLQGLSHSIDPSSIQVSGKGAFIILGVKHQKNYLNEQEMPRDLKILTDSLNWYNNQLIFKKNEREVLNKEEALLLANQKVGGQDGLTAAQLKAMADFFRSRMNDISLEKIEVDEEVKVINQRIAALRNQINEKKAGWVRNTGEIVVTLSSKTSMKAALDFSYIVRNAGWSPSYDIRAKDVKSPIELNYKASVYQNTGVAWNDVDLTLSTANPTLGGQKPELYSWYLNISYPIMIRGAASKRREVISDEEKQMGFAEEDDGWGDLEEVAEVANVVSEYTNVVQTSLNTQFDIALKYSIPSGNKPELVDIQNHQLTADYEYSSAPKLDKDAFLLASITGWEELSLLPGEANVYFEGTFINNTYIDPVNTEDTLKLSLGRDKRIVISRERVKDFTSKKVIGGKKKELFIFEIEVRNTQSGPIKISIEDQIPVSQNKEIAVEMISQGGAKYEESTGKLTWELELAPKESRKLSFEFEVQYPKDKVISGL